MGWPQFLWVGLTALGLGIHLAQHGKPRAAFDFRYAVVDVALASTILYFGGFFTA